MKKISLFIIFVSIFSFSFFVYAEDDTTPPVGTILINNGAEYTNSREVMLTLSAEDSSGVIEMQFNNGTGPYQDWEIYDTKKLWILSASDTIDKTVRVKFKDSLGNENSPGFPAMIKLDTIIPIITLNGEAEITIEKDSIYEDAGATAIDNLSGDLTSSININNPIDTSIVGQYIITYDVSDLAGNKAVQVSRIVNIVDNSLEESSGGEEEIHLNIKESVDVPLNCTVKDIDDIDHNYTTNSYLAICALKSALDNGFISSIKLSNEYPSMGLFVKSFNDVNADSNSQYWAIYQNGNYATSGISSLVISTGDIIIFELHDFSDNKIGDSVTLTINSLITENDLNQSSGGGGSSQTNTETFSVQKAIEFLNNNKNLTDSEMYLDWMAIAVASAKDDYFNSDLFNYLEEYLNKNFESLILTDYERHAMALMSFNINPYSGTKINYIKKIVDSFDGEQFGDKDLINDDIFALIVLKNVGYNSNDEIISKTINYLISKQAESGSWGSVDLTSAGIQALENYQNFSNVSNSLLKAENYLKSFNNDFENYFSASWVLQILNEEEIKEYLNEGQQDDGGMEELDKLIENRLWSTTYVVPAILGKKWNNIMKEFNKEEILESVLLENEEEIKIEESILGENIEEEFIDEIKTKKVELSENLPIENIEKIEENKDQLQNNNLLANVSQSIPTKKIPKKNILLISGSLGAIIGLFFIKFKFF